MKKSVYFVKIPLIIIIFFLATFLACNNKKDLVSPAYNEVFKADNQVLVNRFLHESPSTSEKARQIIADIKKTEAKHPFLAEYARRYGFPEWEYMFGTSISPGNRQAQKGIDFSNQVVVNSSSTANKSSGFYFIPLKDSITKRVKAYIYCQQYNDSTYTYTTYDVEKILAFTPPNDNAKTNKHVSLAIASYFEKQINGTEITNEFKYGIYKNIRIREVSEQSTSQNTIGVQGGIESNVIPVSSCYHVNIYVIEFNGFPIILAYKTPCLPEVVVVANPNPSSGGSSSGGSFFSGIMTPPSFTPPSTGGGGDGSGSGYTPPQYSSYNPPPNWFDWNFLYHNNGYWSVVDPSILPPIEFLPLEIIPDPNIFGNFIDDPSIFEDDPIQVTFDYDQMPWPTIGNVLSPFEFVGIKHNTDNCLDLAQKQISKSGLRDLGYGSAFKVFDRNGGPYSSAAKSGINYIISKLQSGKPVIVGVDNRPGTPSSQNQDGKTDHFITIVGSGQDNDGPYLKFFDNATNNVIKGTSSSNILRYNPSTGLITGTSAAPYANAYGDYIVTQVRKNQ